MMGSCVASSNKVAGVSNDLEGKLQDVDAFAEEEEGDEEKRQAIRFLTSTESCNACSQFQLAGVDGSLNSLFPYETAIGPSSNLQVDKCVPFASVSNASSTSVAGQDNNNMRGIQTFCNAEKEKDKVTSLSLGSGILGISRAFDHLVRAPAIANIAEEVERGVELGEDVTSGLGQRKHKATKSLDKSTFYFHRITLQEKLLHESSQTVDDMREKIRSYRPGDGLSEVGGVGRTSFAVPKMTTLLLVGPSGAGKSTLINNLIRVLENKTRGFDRAQPHEEAGNGSLFLQEYLVCKDANHFSVFDSRGVSENSISEDLSLLRKWMTDGICHGEAVCRPSDNKATKEALEGRGRQRHSRLSAKRKVHFVIFVVDAVAVHRMKKCNDQLAIENLVMLFKSPHLSFKDDRPVVAMTHGDNLSPKDRKLTRIYIGKVFGVSPLDQVFDISCFTGRSVNPGDEDHINDLVLLNMLDFALERADINFSYKNSVASWLVKAHGAIINCWSELDHVIKTALLILLFCLVLLLTAKCAGHS